MFGARDVAISPVAPTAFITLQEAKDYLGISGADEDTVLTALILAASQMIEGYCNALFTQRTVTEIMLPTESIGTLVLTHSPAITLTSFAIDDEAQTVGDFMLMKAASMIRRNDGAALSGLKFQAVYTAGYAAIPDAVKQATKDLVKNMRAAKTRDAAIAAESIVDVGSVTYRDVSGASMTGANGVKLPIEVAVQLAPYVRDFAL